MAQEREAGGTATAKGKAAPDPKADAAAKGLLPPIAPAWVTFIGGSVSDVGDVGGNDWGHPQHTGQVHFPLRERVLIDPNAGNASEKTFLTNLIDKARKMPMFVVEDVKDGEKGEPAKVRYPTPEQRTVANTPRGRANPSGQ